MKQLDATELQEAAEIMAALGPESLAMLQLLFEEAEHFSEDMTEQEWQALGRDALTSDALTANAAILFGKTQPHARQQALSALATLEDRGFLTTDGSQVGLVLDLPPVGFRILHVIWPSLPRFAMERQEDTP